MTATDRSTPFTCQLQPHPDLPQVGAFGLKVEVEHFGDDLYSLSYIADGDNCTIRLPPLVDMPPQQGDNLWQATCFEAFVSVKGQAGYSEFNFSPSLQWAAYRFNGYRSGMRSYEISEPAVSILRNRKTLCFSTTILLSHHAVWSPESIWHLGLSAVIEETDGTKSYWALRHPPGPPDFHHPDCFALELPPPDTP